MKYLQVRLAILPEQMCVASSINAFDHMEFCLVINLTKVLTGLLHGHQ